MKLLHLSMDYPPRMAGGTTVHTYQLARAEVTLGHHVYVVAASAKGAPKHEVMEGVEVTRVARPYTVFSGRAARKLLPAVDIVHGHGNCTRGHLGLNDFPTVVKMHNTFLGEHEHYKRIGKALSMRRSAAMRLYADMDRYSVQKADHVIAISEVVKQETMRYEIPEEKITVIHNGIDAGRFRVPEGTRKKVRERLGLRGVVVGYVGRLEPHKNVSELVEAVAGLKREDVGLLVVGGGEEEDRLRSQALPMGSRAVFTGFVDYDQVPEHYAAADIIVYPSLYEPLGNVILESMAAGKPIIASDRGGIPEIFVKGTGHLVEPGSGELGECLEELISDAAKRRRMGEAGLKAVGSNSWGKVASKTIEVCEKVLAHRAKK